MKLNHLNLCTSDVPGLAGFFADHFGFETVGMLGREAFALLRGSDGFALNIMRIKDGTSASYPDGFHVGFHIGSPAEVRARHAELTAAGLEVGEVQVLMRGGIATTIFYLHAPGGLLVEVSTTTE